MLALAEVLDRLVNDPAFRDRLQSDPEGALAGYALDPADRAALATPGPHWIALVARALRAGEVPAGPSWDPAAEAAADAVVGDAAVVGDPTAVGDPAPAPLPPARVLLRIVPAQRDDGTFAWSVSLLGDTEESRTWLGDAVGVGVHVDLDGGITTARAEVVGAGPPDPVHPDPLGPRWAHQPAEALVGEARLALNAHGDARLPALARYVAAVAGRHPIEAPAGAPLPEPRSGFADITVVGLGLTGIEHVTREAEAAIRRATETMYVEARPGVRAFLAARCARVTPLFHESYRSWDARLATYDHIGARVLDAALDHGPIVLAVQGHPTVFSYVPVLLRDAAPALGLTVHIQPGISAEDCVFAALGIDPADHGIQAFEATDLVLRRRPVAPDVATLIWQVGQLETRLHTARVSRPERLARLVSWMRRFYPADHPIVAIHIPVVPGMPLHLEVSTWADLPALADQLHHAVSVYVPPIGRRLVADPVLAALVDDPAHLARITRPRA